MVHGRTSCWRWTGRLVPAGADWSAGEGAGLAAAAGAASAGRPQCGSACQSPADAPPSSAASSARQSTGPLPLLLRLAIATTTMTITTTTLGLHRFTKTFFLESATFCVFLLFFISLCASGCVHD